MIEIKNLITGFLVILIFFTFLLQAYAYEDVLLEECISSAIENPVTKGIAEKSIQSYCDCALDLIIDHSKDVKESGYECALKNFG